MKAPRPNALTACVILAVLAATVATLPQGPPTVLLEALLVSLLAAEVDRSGRLVALRVVGLAVRLLPPKRRDDLESEWRDHVLLAGEDGLRPVIAAGSIVRAALRLAFRYRVRIAAAVHLMGFMSSQGDTFTKTTQAAKRRGFLARLPTTFAGVMACALAMPSQMIAPQRTRHWPIWLQLATGGTAWITLHMLVGAEIPPSTVRVGVNTLVNASFVCGPSGFAWPRLYVRVIGWIGGKPVANALRNAFPD